jgi:hypothetical protein
MTKERITAPFFRFRCQQYGSDGMLKSDGTGRNTVMTLGKNLLNDTLFRQGTGSSIFMGLKGTGAIAAADTMASHTGWVETTAYSGTSRITLAAAAAVGGTSTFTPGTYAMTGTYTAAGAFITTVVGVSGTTGTLYSAGDFGVTRTGGTGDTLVVTPTLVTA